MTADGRRQQPPRTLNVQKFAEARAPELETLHSIVANRLNDDYRARRSKRRRTTGFDNRVGYKRYRKKQKLGVVGQSKDANTENKKKSHPPRHIRRKLELRSNPQTGFSTSGDGTKRLRTHVWHAKRFTMTKLWGFHLPLGLQGRGRGSRALWKRLRQGVIVHDASYTGAVQLEGPEDMLLSVLSTVLLPFPSANSADLNRNVLSGITYGRAVLHRVRSPSSHMIAPVIYMWRPSVEPHASVHAEGHSMDRCDASQEFDSGSSSRRVWLWIHAAAFKEGYDALKSACEVDEASRSINCISLEGQLAKLEVMGSKAYQLLRKILHPVTCVSGNSGELENFSIAKDGIETQLKNSSIFENEYQISASAVISLMVSDPRASTMRDAQEQNTFVGTLERHTEVLSPPCLKPEERSTICNSTDLWDASRGMCSPFGESVLCMEKHHQRMAFYCLDDKVAGKLHASAEGQCSRLCPIMLLRNSDLGSITRWSIILPLSWVKAIWVPLVSNGSHAIGLREKHWIACEVGLPDFPSDFPDCNAYSCYMEAEAATSDHNAKLRPPSVRPLKVPIPPPWDSVRFPWDEKSCVEELCAKNVVSGDSLENLGHRDSDLAALHGHGASFEGFVARTSYTLTQLLNDIYKNRLLLFPITTDGKRSISEFMKDEKMLTGGPSGSIFAINCDQNLCCVRVVLHAYKEGVFEEGAVICAPHISDIALWTHRSEHNKSGLKISEASLKSYFVQQPSGKWELQVPDDPIARESHRLPVGFVTAGFVRGSKKPVAGSICSAVLLARLREEQWNAVPVNRRRKEIYVLVRNLRSTVYRLALADIVLEQLAEDVEYI